jgi:hypothetical protein
MVIGDEFPEPISCGNKKLPFWSDNSTKKVVEAAVNPDVWKCKRPVLPVKQETE